MAESSVPNKQGVLELNPKFLKQNQATLQNLKYGETNALLNSVNFNFGVALMKEGLLTKEQFLENNNNNRLYNFKNDKDETPFKDVVDNIKVTNVNQEDIPFVIVDGNTIPLTEKNKKYLDSINFDYSKPQTKSDIKSQPIEGDIDEQYIEGTEFDVKPEKPFALMSIEERREFQNKKAQERKEKIRKKNEEFNKKIAEANKRRQNNAVKSVKTNLPNENPDA